MLINLNIFRNVLVNIPSWISYGTISDLIALGVSSLILKLTEAKQSEVKFFTDAGSGCRSHIYNKEACPNESCGYRNIRKIMDFMDKAEETLDICIYLVTCHGLADSILDAHKRNVRVRIIADADMADGSGSQINTFTSAGIPVRMKESPFLMHHKFFIVDKRILVTGSFNWTMQAITGNWDNVIAAYTPGIVEPFDKHFEQLWEDFGILVESDNIQDSVQETEKEGTDKEN